jgi:hypothetical protein
MALATLQGAPVSGLHVPHYMVLSHTPNDDNPTPVPPVLPIRVGYRDGHIGVHMDAQAVFLQSRFLGAIKSVRVNVDLGGQDPEILIQYWDEQGASGGLRMYNEIIEGRRAHPVNLYILKCTVRTVNDLGTPGWLVTRCGRALEPPQPWINFASCSQGCAAFSFHIFSLTPMRVQYGDIQL